MHTETIEYGGFVFNTDTHEWECLFVSEISAPVAHNRALEKAMYLNSFAGREKYRAHVQVWKRRRVTGVGEWKLVKQ